MKKHLLLSIVFLLLISFNALSQEIKAVNNADDIKQTIESKKGKVILVNFWATWCKPCVAEFPEIVKLYNDYKEKDVEVIFISADVPEEVNAKVRPFLAKQGVNFDSYFINTSDVEGLINYFDPNWQGSIPSTYIFNKEGKITASITGKRTYEQFEEEIRKNID